MLMTAIQNQNIQLIQYLIENHLEFIQYEHILESLNYHSTFGISIQEYLLSKSVEKLNLKQKKDIFYKACEMNLLPIVKIFSNQPLFTKEEVPLMLSLQKISIFQNCDVFFFLLFNGYPLPFNSFIWKYLKQKDLQTILFQHFVTLSEKEQKYFLKPSFLKLLKHQKNQYPSFENFLSIIKMKKRLHQSLKMKDDGSLVKY